MNADELPVFWSSARLSSPFLLGSTEVQRSGVLLLRRQIHTVCGR